VVNRLSSLVCTALLAPVEGRGADMFQVSREMVDTEPMGSRGDGYRSCVSAKTKLPPGSILEKLLVLQTQSDMDELEAQDLRDKLLIHVNTSVEDLHQVLLWQTNTLFTSAASLQGPDIGAYSRCMTPDDTSDVASLSTLSDVYHKNASSSKGAAANQPCLSFSSDDFCDVRRLQQFLLSVTAKDVSLLVTFRRVDNPIHETGHLPSIRLGDRLYRVMISAVDLDPKPINRIRRWLKQKDEMLKTYSNFKKCV